MIKNQQYFLISYCIKFLSLVLGFYYFSIGFNGIVSPEGGYYSSFLDHYFNYIDWIRQSNIYLSNIMAHALGTNSYVADSQMLKVGKNIEVEIWLPCLGLGVISFWSAFIITNSGSFKRKLTWGILGNLAIWFINSCRITLLLVALDRDWKESPHIDHHDMFNIVAYGFIFLLMYFYTKNMAPSNISSDSINYENTITQSS
jgi:exosortase/archaeosortase family protein